MTERFTYDNKQVAILKNGEFWLECAISTACNQSEICNELNALVDENEELKKELSEYKDFVLSDDKILCYTCLFCTHKGIYEVDCDVKGHVDVHGTCHSYTQKELQK